MKKGAASRKATRKDCNKIAKRMRPSDQLEVLLASGHTPEVSIHASFDSSETRTTMLYDGEVVGMCGVRRVDSLMGIPWMLATDGLTESKQRRLAFLIASKRWIIQKQKEYPMLVNQVHGVNTDSIRWLQFLGFTMIRRVILSKEVFYEFIRIQ